MKIYIPEKSIVTDLLDVVLSKLSKSSAIADLILFLILLLLRLLLGVTAILHPSSRERLKEKNFTAHIRTRDNSVGRSFTFA